MSDGLTGFQQPSVLPENLPVDIAHRQSQDFRLPSPSAVMADRLPQQFKMLPNNFAPGLSQQQPQGLIDPQMNEQGLRASPEQQVRMFARLQQHQQHVQARPPHIQTPQLTMQPQHPVQNIGAPLGQMQNQSSRQGFFPGGMPQPSNGNQHPHQPPDLQQLANMGSQHLMVPQQGLQQPGAQQPFQPHQEQSPPTVRQATYGNLRARALSLHNKLRQIEAERDALIERRATMPDVQFQAENAQMFKEINQKRLILRGWIAEMKQVMDSNGAQDGPGGVLPDGGDMNGASGSNVMHQLPGHLAQNNPRPGPSPSQSFHPPSAPQLLPDSSSQLQNERGATPQMQHLSVNPMRQPPQRTARTPVHFLPGGQGNVQTSPSMMPSQFAGQMPNGPSQPMHGPQNPPQAVQRTHLPGLPPTTFATAYGQFCARSNMKVDTSQIQFEGRTIELHRLYNEVNSVGGPAAATHDELWPVIGAKLGFVQLPASDNEPAKSGPGVAIHLQNIYRQYLDQFNTAYYNSLMSQRKRLEEAQAQAQAQAQTMPPNGNAVNVNPAQGVSGSNAPMQNAAGMAGMSQQPSVLANALNLQGLAALIGISDPLQINKILSLCNTPAAELHQRKIPPAIINLVEANRSVLQASLLSQKAFHGAVAKHATANGVPGSFRASNDMGQQDAMSIGGRLTQPIQALPRQPGPAQGQPMPSGGNSNAQNGAPQQKQIQVVAKQDVPIQSGRFPTEAELQQGRQYVDMLRHEYTYRIQQMRAQPVAEEHRPEYDMLFDQLWCYTKMVEPQLHIYSCAFNDGVMRRLTAAALTTVHQKVLSEAGQPRYLIKLENLRNIMYTMKVAVEQFPYPGFVSSGVQQPPQPIIQHCPPDGMQSAKPGVSDVPLSKLSIARPQPPFNVPPSPSAWTPLLAHQCDEATYGTGSPVTPFNNRILKNMTLKMASISTASIIVLGGTLWLALSSVEGEVRGDLRVPIIFMAVLLVTMTVIGLCCSTKYRLVPAVDAEADIDFAVDHTDDTTTLLEKDGDKNENENSEREL